MHIIFLAISGRISIYSVFLLLYSLATAVFGGCCFTLAVGKFCIQYYYNTSVSHRFCYFNIHVLLLNFYSTQLPLPNCVSVIGFCYMPVYSIRILCFNIRLFYSCLVKFYFIKRVSCFGLCFMIKKNPRHAWLGCICNACLCRARHFLVLSMCYMRNSFCFIRMVLSFQYFYDFIYFSIFCSIGLAIISESSLTRASSISTSNKHRLRHTRKGSTISNLDI